MGGGEERGTTPRGRNKGGVTEADDDVSWCIEYGVRFCSENSVGKGSSGALAQFSLLCNSRL